MTATCANPAITARKTTGPAPLTWISAALSARRQRQALARLDDHLLNDLGLTGSQARREASRRLWEVPANCLRPAAR